MSKQEADLIHYMNRVKQLEWLLEEEREKNKRLMTAVAEVRFEGRSLLKKLEKL